MLGASDEIDDFVRVFVEKRKGSDYLRVGATNVCRFTASEIDGYKTTFKKVRRILFYGMNALLWDDVVVVGCILGRAQLFPTCKSPLNEAVFPLHWAMSAKAQRESGRGRGTRTRTSLLLRDANNRTALHCHG